MKTRTLIVAYLAMLLAGLSAATQWVASLTLYHPALGGLRLGSMVVYPPWALLSWSQRFGDDIPRALNEGYEVLAGAFILATLLLIVARLSTRRRRVRELGPRSLGQSQDGGGADSAWS